MQPNLARPSASVRPTRVHRILHRMYLAFTMYVTYGWRRREGNRYLEKTWHGEKEGEGGTRERGAENENGLARSLGIVCSVLSDFPFRSNNNGSSGAAGDKLVKAESAFEQVDEDILLCRYEAPSS